MMTSAYTIGKEKITHYSIKHTILFHISDSWGYTNPAQIVQLENARESV